MRIQTAEAMIWVTISAFSGAFRRGDGSATPLAGENISSGGRQMHGIFR
jgi:hypothetical protein